MRILNLEPERYEREIRSDLEAAHQVSYRHCETQDEMLRALAEEPWQVVMFRLGLAFDRAAFAAAPDLVALATPTTGLDHIDCEEAQRLGVEVVSLRGETKFLHSVQSTAEHTWALLLALHRKLDLAFADTRQGRWRREPFLAAELNGSTLGIVGLGRLGKRIARYALAFDMRVLAHDTSRRAFAEAPSEVENVELDQLLAEADVLSLHLPLDTHTRGYLSRDRIRRLRRGAVVVNTARGELIDEQALLEALADGHLAGAALDVLVGDGRWDESGPTADHPLLSWSAQHRNLLITPHMAGYGQRSISLTRRFLTAKLLRALKGRAQ